MAEQKHHKGHIAVTGAAGFIGSRLVKQLLEDGYKVTAHIHRRRLPDQAGLSIVQGDIGDGAIRQTLLQDADAVIHLAAFIPPNYEDSSYAEDCLKLNSMLTLRLAEAATQKNMRFINFST